LPPKGAARAAAPGSAPATTPTTPTAPAASPSAAPTPGGTYTVREGDTLYSIAKALFGDGTRWDELYDANKATIGADPKSLRTGMKLSMPR
jgi:nucleoid-associated protein YgaU